MGEYTLADAFERDRSGIYAWAGEESASMKRELKQLGGGQHGSAARWPWPATRLNSS
jgi:hypothetical protein